MEQTKAKSTTSKTLKPKGHDAKEAEAYIRENKRILKRRKKAYLKALEASRPDVNVQEVLADFNKIADEYSGPLVKTAVRVLGIVNAVGYANDELQKGLNAIDTEIPEAEVREYATKMMRLQVIQLISVAMKLDKSMLDRILSLQISKDFGTMRLNTVSVPPAPPLTTTTIKRPNAKTRNKDREESTSLFRIPKKK